MGFIINKKMFFSIAIVFSSSLFAQEDCSKYRNPSNTKFEINQAEGTFKIAITVQRPIDFDDVRIVTQQRKIAVMEGTKQVAAWLETHIKSSTSVKEAALNATSFNSGGANGPSKKATTDMAEQFLDTLSQNTEAALRGIIPLDECYTPGKELRVTVGLKSDTIRAADTAAGHMNKSLNENPTPKSQNSAQNSSNNNVNKNKDSESKKNEPGPSPLNKLEGYRGSDAIDKF